LQSHILYFLYFLIYKEVLPHKGLYNQSLNFIIYEETFVLFMYRRPILCTLHGAVDFFKFLKIAVVGGVGGCYWDIVHILYPCR
jgi:hypothetical protein